MQSIIQLSYPFDDGAEGDCQQRFDELLHRNVLRPGVHYEALQGRSGRFKAGFTLAQSLYASLAEIIDVRVSPQVREGSLGVMYKCT